MSSLSFSRRRRPTRFRSRLALATALVAPVQLFVGGVPRISAQATTGTISGTVEDVQKAVIPNAQVILVNKTNKFTFRTKTNSDGVFTFSSINFGDYDLTVTVTGFEKYNVRNVHLDPGDQRTLPEIQMKLGEATASVTVNADDQNRIDDTGERSDLISQGELNKLTLEGRDVSELLKILPGSAIQNVQGGYGGSTAISNSTYDNSNTQLGGASGSYAMSGNPSNGVSIRSDGANLTDPGTYSGGLQNINPDATEEVKVEQSNFGADTANGPLVINAVGKQGGANYHGSIYVNARTYQLNSTDAFAKEVGYAKPPDRYIYPGGTFGGPVLFPGTNFNHQKHLTFFLSGEDLAQRNTYAYGNASSALQTTLVPTAGMRAGDFSVAQLSQYVPQGLPICGPASAAGCNPTSPFQNISVVPRSAPNGTQITCNGVAGDCLAPYLDPGAVAQFKLFPLPNRNFTTVNQPYNYSQENLDSNNLWQARGRLDFKPSDRNTFSVIYNVEMGNTAFPQASDYFAAGNSGGLSTPGGSTRNEHTHSGSANWTRVFSASLTNEFILTGTYSDHFDNAGNPSQLFNSAIGYPYGGAYLNNTKQFPTLLDYGYDGLPLGIFPDYSYGPIYSKTLVPGGADNLTKVIKQHTLKFGFNAERPNINNLQTNVGTYPTNGGISNYYTSPTFYLPNAAGAQQVYHNSCFSPSDAYCSSYSMGNSNALANYIGGIFSQYTQANIDPHLNLYNWSTSLYATDDWKVRKNLSVTFGVRLEHLGRWTDNHGNGAAVFVPSDYASDAVGAASTPLPGFRWHSIDSSIPLGGWPTRAFFYEPRVGFNWDIYGTGKTTLSGGYGQYRFHEGQSDAQNVLSTTTGLRSITVNNPNTGGLTGTAGLTMNYVDSLQLSPSPANAGSTFSALQTGYQTTTTQVYGLQAGDSQSPLTSTYSLTMTQQLPSNLTLSVGYSGNNSNYLLNDGSNQQIYADNINALPVGSLFQPDPNAQSTFKGITYTAANIPGISSAQQNDWRPYPHYGDLLVASHSLWANYNGLQVALNRNKGNLTYGVNYTWSKSMGVHGSYFNGIPGDSFNPWNNYGPLASDRTNIFNSWYDYNVGQSYHGNRALRIALNGWELSGYTGLQSGQNLQSSYYATNFGIQGYIPATATQQQYAIENLTYLGTPDVSLQPTVTCNPSSGLHKGQYINQACFGLPAQGGANGSFIFPYIHGPAFIQSDLSAVKNVKLAESQQLQFRIGGFNFLNHPLATFSNKAPTQEQLIFPQTASSNPGFGSTTYESGRRVVELGAKYTF